VRRLSAGLFAALAVLLTFGCSSPLMDFLSFASGGHFDLGAVIFNAPAPGPSHAQASDSPWQLNACRLHFTNAVGTVKQSKATFEGTDPDTGATYKWVGQYTLTGEPDRSIITVDNAPEETNGATWPLTLDLVHEHNGTRIDGTATLDRQDLAWQGVADIEGTWVAPH